MFLRKVAILVPSTNFEVVISPYDSINDKEIPVRQVIDVVLKLFR